jgi:ADP-heptose:LPS heptosyltransferase
MYLKPLPEMLANSEGVLKYHNKENKPTVLLVMTSQHPQLPVGGDNFGMGKSINLDQLPDIVEGLRNRGYFVFTIHSERQAEFDRLGVEQFTSIHPQAWISLVSLADYVITIDTATLHIAGGLKKPTVAVFAFTPSLPYIKYYTNIEPIQGPCPWGYQGCFTTYIHCKKKDAEPFPCQAGLVSSDILASFDRLVRKFPLGKSPTSESVQKSRQIDLLAHTA